jgi:hypothetical protein
MVGGGEIHRRIRGTEHLVKDATAILLTTGFQLALRPIKLATLSSTRPLIDPEFWQFSGAGLFFSCCV